MCTMTQQSTRFTTSLLLNLSLRGRRVGRWLVRICRICPTLHTAIQQPCHAQPATASGSGVQTSLSSIPFPAGTYVTPALSSKVSVAAQSNPVLANLLKAVISRTATDDQVKTLGLLIQSLEGVQSLEQPNPTLLGMSTAQFSPRSSSPKPFDIVLEFHERSSDRFILPRGDVVCELAAPKTESPYRASDVIITCCVPFANAASLQTTPLHTEPPDNVTPEVVSFRISRVSQAVWELLSTWAGGPQKIEESRVKLAEIVSTRLSNSNIRLKR